MHQNHQSVSPCLKVLQYKETLYDKHSINTNNLHRNIYTLRVWVGVLVLQSAANQINNAS